MSLIKKALPCDSFQQKVAEGYIILDLRPVEEFIGGFIPGSVFLQPSANLHEFTSLLFPGKKFILADAVPEETAAKIEHKNLQVDGYLDGGPSAWQVAGRKLDLIIDIEADEFAIDLPFDEKLLVLDVRPAQKYSITHVTGAIHMSLPQFADLSSMARFEEDWNIYIYGSSDNDSVTANSLMQRQGFYNVRNISGGFKSILKQDNIPIEKGGTPEEI